MSMPHVYCMGPLVLDRVLELDRLPGPDDKVFIGGKREAAGGPPRNSAMALVGWGTRVSVVSVIGDDAVGMTLLARVNEAGIGSEAIEIVPDLATGATIILVDPNGERAILIDPIAEPVLATIGSRLQPAAGDVVTSNLFHPEAVPAAFARARAAGAKTVLDVEWPELQRWGWDAARAAIASADIVTTNSQILRAFAEDKGIEPDIDAALALARSLQVDGNAICVTLGAQGVVAAKGEETFRIAALPVKPRDTTGASDRFLAGLVHALLGGASFDLALRQAVAAAGVYLGGGETDWKAVQAAARTLKNEPVGV
ncbi:carbohydrate kinase family protein [Kaistia nematophila]|uniref:Carbohydrate kinase family protein n=1 Tax=Kaistia nematophila TaxID=2994654 RepID=A0A9X3IM14_9HYPH|nr:carbohydrate kinase family protein [Kaistia nematophila]MCX5569390.1 carbohydrate kinase family protein [Kaistia nematophila]